MPQGRRLHDGNSFDPLHGAVEHHPTGQRVGAPSPRSDLTHLRFSRRRATPSPSSLQGRSTEKRPRRIAADAANAASASPTSGRRSGTQSGDHTPLPTLPPPSPPPPVLTLTPTSDLSLNSFLRSAAVASDAAHSSRRMALWSCSAPGRPPPPPPEGWGAQIRRRRWRRSPASPARRHRGSRRQPFGGSEPLHPPSPRSPGLARCGRRAEAGGHSGTTRWAGGKRETETQAISQVTELGGCPPWRWGCGGGGRHGRGGGRDGGGSNRKQGRDRFVLLYSRIEQGSSNEKSQLGSQNHIRLSHQAESREILGGQWTSPQPIQVISWRAHGRIGPCGYRSTPPPPETSVATAPPYSMDRERMASLTATTLCHPAPPLAPYRHLNRRGDCCVRSP